MKKLALALTVFGALVAMSKPAAAQYPYYFAPVYAPVYAPRVVYRPAYPVYVAPVPVVAAPVYAVPVYPARVKTYYRAQPVRNVVRVVTPGARVWAY